MHSLTVTVIALRTFIAQAHLNPQLAQLFRDLEFPPRRGSHASETESESESEAHLNRLATTGANDKVHTVPSPRPPRKLWLMEKFVGNLFDRAVKPLPLDHQDLDDSTLAKTQPGRSHVVSYATSGFPVPQTPFLAGHSSKLTKRERIAATAAAAELPFRGSRKLEWESLLLGIGVPRRDAQEQMSFPQKIQQLPGPESLKKIAFLAMELNNRRNLAVQAKQQESALTEKEQKEKEDWLLLSGILANQIEQEATHNQGSVRHDEMDMDGYWKDGMKIEPKKLEAKDMAGVSEPLGLWDPLGLATDVSEGKLLFYREVEIKHGRVAMLASLGISIGEQFHPLWGGDIDVPSYVAFQQTPLQAFWPAVVAACAIPEAFSILTFKNPDFRKEGPLWTIRKGMKVTDSEGKRRNRIPGDLGFDPLGLRPQDPDELKVMQTKELNNGRLAMIAAAGMIAQQLATGQKLFVNVDWPFTDRVASVVELADQTLNLVNLPLGRT